MGSAHGPSPFLRCLRRAARVLVALAAAAAARAQEDVEAGYLLNASGMVQVLLSSGATSPVRLAWMDPDTGRQEARTCRHPFFHILARGQALRLDFPDGGPATFSFVFVPHAPARGERSPAPAELQVAPRVEGGARWRIPPAAGPSVCYESPAVATLTGAFETPGGDGPGLPGDPPPAAPDDQPAVPRQAGPIMKPDPAAEEYLFRLLGL